MASKTVIRPIVKYSFSWLFVKLKTGFLIQGTSFRNHYDRNVSFFLLFLFVFGCLRVPFCLLFSYIIVMCK